jgi:hypothetical protein
MAPLTDGPRPEPAPRPQASAASSTPAPRVPAPARPPQADLDPRHTLAAYPHIASCPSCVHYAADYLRLHPAPQVVIAALAHHDSCHRHDPLCPASQYFAATF